jgi:hypothetical protein
LCIDIRKFSDELKNDRNIILHLDEIPEKLSCDKELLLEISKNKVIDVGRLDSSIFTDTTFVHKLLRCRGRNIHYTKYDWMSLFPVHIHCFGHEKKYMIPRIFDYFKMGKYETVVRTILKLGLPIELSRNVCKFL